MLKRKNIAQSIAKPYVRAILVAGCIAIRYPESDAIYSEQIINYYERYWLIQNNNFNLGVIINITNFIIKSNLDIFEYEYIIQ